MVSHWSCDILLLLYGVEWATGLHQEQTDVFEVPIEMVAQTSNHGDVKTKESNISHESPEKPRSDDALTALTAKNEEVSLLKLKIEETEKNLEAFRQENDGLKRQLSKANMNSSSLKDKDEKLSLKFTQLEDEDQNYGVEAEAGGYDFVLDGDHGWRREGVMNVEEYCERLG
ncbi:hypothetical protein L2E82_31845 [Cichorium intybus]|uniref:Uncharacterized protein n=1 Tax=Cichorium intybus TaxID=13427 RepID=A0ACB9BFY8_CICIN|nr:hypothetical protein L2E82_31845 [Cichorium intybus]